MERKRRTTRTLRPKSPSFPAMSTTTITDTNQAARTFLAGDEARIDGDIKVRGEAIYTADISRERLRGAPQPRAHAAAFTAHDPFDRRADGSAHERLDDVS